MINTHNHILNNELQHHGIKGQKWGVRRTPAQLGHRKTIGSKKVHKSKVDPNKKYVSDSKSTVVGNTISTALDSRNKKSSNAASSPTTSPLSNKISSPWKKTGMMLQNGMTYREALSGNKYVKVKSQKEADNDFVIRKGQIVQHIMDTPVKDMNGRSHLFIAATEADKKNYAGFFAALTKYRRNVDKMYSLEMEATEALVSPSKKKRVDEFLKLYEKDKHNISRELAEFNKREYGGYYKKPLEHYVKEFENMPVKKLKSEGYYTFFNSLFSSNYNREQYFNQLKEQGYNSVIDDNDKRSFMQSQAPLIVFDAFQSLKTKKVSELTQRDINQNMYEWSKMKHSEEDGEKFKMDIYANTGVLMHHGTKNMKWGVRRYQNKDGSLTPLGKKRYQKQEEEASKKNKGKPPKVDEWVKSDMTSARKLADESSGLANKLKNINDTSMKNAPKSKMDLSSMTDKEMRDRINRAMLEKQYNDMFAPQKVSKGKEYAGQILEGTIATLGVASSALGIALAIKELKG